MLEYCDIPGAISFVWLIETNMFPNRAQERLGKAGQQLPRQYTHARAPNKASCPTIPLLHM